MPESGPKCQKPEGEPKKAATAKAVTKESPFREASEEAPAVVLTEARELAEESPPDYSAGEDDGESSRSQRLRKKGRKKDSDRRPRKGGRK